MSADTGSATDAPPPPPPPPPPRDQPPRDQPPRDQPPGDQTPDRPEPRGHPDRPEPESRGRDGTEPRDTEPTPELESFLADKRAEVEQTPEQPRPASDRPEAPVDRSDVPTSRPASDRPAALDAAASPSPEARPPESSVPIDDGSPARGATAPDDAVEGPRGRSGSPALAERGDADRLLDEEPPPDPTSERGDAPRASAPDPAAKGDDGPATDGPATDATATDPATPVDRRQEVVEPPAHEAVEEAFPDLYRYGERPRIVETEPFRPPERWVNDRNPGYHEQAPGRTDNCGDVSRSSEYTWRGQDTRAVPISEEAEREGGEDNDVMDHWSPGDRVPTSFDDIQRGLEELGPGSSAIVGVDWAGGDGGGHWFNAFNDDGRIVAGDGQDGTSEEWPPTGTLRFTEADCSTVDAIFVDASGTHLTRDELPKGIIR